MYVALEVGKIYTLNLLGGGATSPFQKNSPYIETLPQTLHFLADSSYPKCSLNNLHFEWRSLRYL